ncbi:hypothetical protein [Sphingomonas daechungensis]|uniref:hypothetical protein n=1 Tax=Sphingomonas daechungensis TaxID=1176646 RepID=UPI00294FF85F|nr:hypothetical protein [Sphingomonas daechungensis]
MSTRGAHLVHGDRGFMTGGSLIARAIAPGVDTLIDAVHRKMERGGIDATLPDGSRRRVGFHRPGPAARLEVKSWMALVRLGFSGSVGWYKAWDLGEWTSPDLVPLFELFSLNAVTLGTSDGQKVRRAGSTLSPIGCATMRRSAPRRISPPTTISATISIRPGSTRR